MNRPDEVPMVIVTRSSHPALFECLETISHDMGAGAGHTNYSVPSRWASLLNHIEDSVTRLTIAERETLCIGEESEAESLVAQYELTVADCFLHDFFSDWEY